MAVSAPTVYFVVLPVNMGVVKAKPRETEDKRGGRGGDYLKLDGFFVIAGQHERNGDSLVGDIGKLMAVYSGYCYRLRQGLNRDLSLCDQVNVKETILSTRVNESS